MVSSNRRRPPEECAVLQQKGSTVVVIELQGSLFFAAVERLMRQLSVIVGKARIVILDLKRVQFADAAARSLLRRIMEEPRAHVCALGLSHVGDAPAGFQDLAEIAQRNGIRLFVETDAAIEHGEDLLISTEVPLRDQTRFALARMEVFKGLDAACYRELEGIIRPRRFDVGTVIVHEGDAADLFYVIARGSVSVQLNLGGGRSKRLAVIGPGLTFGEMALFDGGRRSADVVALEAVVAYGLSVEALRELGRKRPEILLTIFGNINRDLSERLRRANAEIRALA
jgi:glutaminase